MSGYVGDLTAQQEKALEQFRENVKGLLKPNQGDHFLLRWLRARDFDVKKAESMFRAALDWRRDIGADTILQDFEENPIIEKYRTGGIIGYDKTGCPIYIDPYGLVDMKGLLHSVKKRDLIRKFVQVMETLSQMCVEQSEKSGTHIEQFVVIYDLRKINFDHMWKPAVDMYLKMVDAAESKYPEVLKKVFVINSPRLFPVIWSIVRPFLHENTAKKVEVLTNNYKDALLELIDADQLPKCYGGNLTDPDGNPRCVTMVCQGGIVPKDCYNQNEPHIDMTSHTIGRGSTLKMEYEVHVPNSVLRYEFQTEGYDVGFGIFRKDRPDQVKTADMEAVLPTQRSNSHLVPEDGAVECEKPGTYIVRFDNTYSWARSKKIFYQIEVLEPKTSNRNQDNSNYGDEAGCLATANCEINTTNVPQDGASKS